MSASRLSTSERPLSGVNSRPQGEHPPQGSPVKFHDTRHTAASRIVMAGGSLLDAGEHLSHSTPTMTKRYAHLSADHRARIAELTSIDFVASASREPVAEVVPIR
jgi:integrase